MELALAIIPHEGDCIRRRREVVARLEANKAVSRLRQAMGLTLEAYAIRLP